MSEKIDATSDAGIGGAAGNTGSGGPKAIIKNVDMSEEMQQESVDIASAALDKYTIEKDIAAQIKKEFDKRHGATWHVVVGKNFGSYVTHGTPLFIFSPIDSIKYRSSGFAETKHFIYFYIGSLAILIWKS
jgi:dynein light chain LC8-type